MFEVSARMMTARLTRVQADASLEFPYQRFLAAITPRTKLIIVASPNNPTGAVVSRDRLLAICAAAPQAVVLVDEAYYHFHGESLLADVATVPNLLVARTFSKAYGLANLRIGLLAGNAALMKYVRKVSSPYNVNGVALACLPVALADDAYVAWYAEQVNAGRARMMDGLRALGVDFFPSHANFVLMKIGAEARRVGGCHARARRAAARPLHRPRLRWLRPHHHRRRGSRHARPRRIEGILAGDWMEKQQASKPRISKSATARGSSSDESQCASSANRDVKRKTTETKIALTLTIDGQGAYSVSTGIRFFDHMLELFTRHGGFDLTLACKGDLDVDQHHTVEDVGIALGEAFAIALGDKKGILRAGYFVMAMDETLAVAAVDLSGRVACVVDDQVTVPLVGDFQTELLPDFFDGFARGAKANVHVKTMYGRSNHHKIEAIFKAFARAMRGACSRDERMKELLPSTKGLL